ncbi:queuosine precursor transporter [Fangia hongkongensis]|uniref:queuosine precursor transporter n=2 Tax=Fangia hongkongensis TaxID=270495 RepID=UPI00037D6150|nr:queuosine precursor transporter [Fangia hongkongensis]
MILPASAFIFPITYPIADIITEVYGFNVTKLVIWSSVAMGFISTTLIMLVINLPAPDFWNNNDAFRTVLGNTWRIVIGGYIGNIVGSFINAILISKLKIAFKNKYFLLRSVMSSIIGVIIYVLVAGTIILYGMTSFEHAVNIMFSNYMAKVLFIAVFSYPAAMLCGFLKKQERMNGGNPEEFNTNFNPFQLKA